MNLTEKMPFIAAVNAVLSPNGFKLKKAHFLWRKDMGASNEAWVHLNFGLGVINPSVGVKYGDLESALPANAGQTPGVFEMLSSLSKVPYHAGTHPEDMARDIVRHGLPSIRRLLDRRMVIALLERDPADWPVLGASARMRLLPILLASQGRSAEALHWVEHFEQNELYRDQQIPRYSAFAASFRTTIGG